MKVREVMRLQNQNETPALTYEQVSAAIDRVSTNTPVRDKAAVAFLFLTGVRISELLEFKRKEVKKGVEEVVTYPPIRKSDISLTPDGFDVNGVRTLKRRYGFFPRTIVVIDSDEWMHKFIQTFMHHYDSIKDPDAPLFSGPSGKALHRSRVWIILNKYCGNFPHIYRHSRATCLANKEQMPAHMILKYFNWGDARTAMRYTHPSVEDIRQHLQRKK